MSKIMTFDVRSIVKVYDGDTFTVILDRGFHDYSERSVRLRGVDTPEMRGVTKAQGRKVRQWVATWLANALRDGHLSLVSYELEGDKYGRVLGDMLSAQGSLYKYLLGNGLAKAYQGGTKAEWTQAELKKIDNFC